MTAELKQLTENCRQIITISFDDPEEYKKFVEAVSQSILCDWDFMNEFTDDVALSIVERHLHKLSAAILDRLIENKIRGQAQNENPRPQENA